MLESTCFFSGENCAFVKKNPIIFSRAHNSSSFQGCNNKQTIFSNPNDVIVTTTFLFHRSIDLSMKFVGRWLLMPKCLIVFYISWKFLNEVFEIYKLKRLCAFKRKRISSQASRHYLYNVLSSRLINKNIHRWMLKKIKQLLHKNRSS